VLRMKDAAELRAVDTEKVCVSLCDLVVHRSARLDLVYSAKVSMLSASCLRIGAGPHQHFVLIAFLHASSLLAGAASHDVTSAPSPLPVDAL
jgi:hypothetical protein